MNKSHKSISCDFSDTCHRKYMIFKLTIISCTLTLDIFLLLSIEEEETEEDGEDDAEDEADKEAEKEAGEEEEKASI